MIDEDALSTPLHWRNAHSKHPCMALGAGTTYSIRLGHADARRAVVPAPFVLAGIGALAIPGLGPFIAAGPLLAALSGAAAGATVGGIAGALIGLGIPEIEAKRYEGKIKSGNILLSVHTEKSDEQKRAEEIFKTAHADDICSTREASVPKAKDSHANA
jgi:outer membrane lipoprotein SlyB